MQSQTVSLPLTHLQEAEVRNALRLKVFRREITAIVLRDALSLLDGDIREGRLERPHYDAFAVYQRAELLSHRYSVTTGARMLDILHVAAALEIKSNCFVSFDHRQRTVAKKAKIKLLPTS
jgi:predicted nucleic acid-binding protein